MPARRPAVPLALAALTGAALGPLVPLPVLVGLSSAAPASGLVALRRRGRLAPRSAVTLLLIGVAGLAGVGSRWRREARDALPAATSVVVAGRATALRGALVEGPVPAGPGRVRVVVAGRREHRVLVTAPARALAGLPVPGATVVALGRFRAPAPRPGGRDPAEALREAGAVARFDAVDVRIAPPAERAGLVAACVRHARNVIDRGASRRHAAFLRAVLLGERGGIDRAALEAFRRTGTAHLLSISGLHVTVLGSLVLLLARGLGLRRLEQALAVSLCLGLYVVVAGAGTPTVRAAAAGVVAVALIGRGDAWNRLAVGLLAALAVEPGAALQVGTALSFGTVAGLVLLEPAARRALRHDDPLGRARPAPGRAAGLLDRLAGLVPASLAAFLASAPLIAVTLGQLPLASLLLNPPCIALFTAALALGVAGVLGGAVTPALGHGLVALADVPTAGIFALVEAGAALPDAPLVPPLPAAPLLAACALGVAVVRRERGARSRELLAAGVVLLLAVALPRPARAGGAPLAPPRAPAEVAVVTCGAAVIVGSPDGALGFGPPPASLRRALPGLDRACGTRRVRWVADDARAARLPGGRVVVLGPGLALIELRHLTALVATRGATPGDVPHADVVIAPRARRSLVSDLLDRSGAGRALVARDQALPRGVTRLATRADGAVLFGE